ELQLADIVMVASSFTKRTLEHAAGFQGSVVTIPYGAPRLELPLETETPSRVNSKLRVLFVGSLGQRKGLSYLFRAMRLLGTSADVTVIGARPMVPCSALDRELASIRWIPTCSHREVLAEMAAHDAFVFPSLFEGFGLVLLVAMAMGLPIITTPNTAGPDLIDEGREGFIVPIRNARAIAEKLALLHGDRTRRDEMSQLARRRAAQFTWEDYGAKLSACIQTALGNHPASAHA